MQISIGNLIGKMKRQFLTDVSFPEQVHGLELVSRVFSLLENCSAFRAVPKIFHYEARPIAHVDIILISS